ATGNSHGGEIYVMTMPRCRMIDLAEVLIEACGEEQVRIVEKGIRPGETIHQILMSDYESLTTVVYDEHYFGILPTLEIVG
ncbi:polysaccharide biosynthesis protein, partial [Paenibacillus sp. UMB4589-SE434]|uniref:polysaccharide biosynthesis protein n=1 Tax=Paenibacillus sp. UMB4589-SE434 TaxID=3046314 RepID=UPI0025505B51